MKKKIRSTSLSFFNKSLFLFFSINVLLCNFSYAQCDLTVDAGPDQMECTIPATFQLSGSISDVSFPFEWSPTTGLSDPNSLTPNASISTTTTYTLTGKSIDYSADLIVNGDFSGGDTGFSTDYSYNASPSFPFNELVEGQYSISNDPAPMHVNWESCGDHTTGTGNMMNVNGSEFANQNAWCQTINVTPNTEYAFSAWVTSVDPNGPCEIQFNINGIAVGDGNIGLSNTCEWINFFVLWNSGANATAEVCIEDVNLAEFGNDFAIDDIVFAPTCTVTDDVTLTVSELTAFADSEHLLCSGETLNLTASSPTGNSFEWSGPLGFTASGTSVSIPNLTTSQQGNYTVTVTNPDGCVTEASTAVAILESNEVESTEYTCDPSEVGTFTQDLTNLFGCDSIVTLTVSLADSDLFEFTETSCDSDEVGVFTQNLSNQFGCDSTIITTVNLDESNLINLSDTTCDPADVGVFTQDLSNQYGCDSTVITTVTLSQASMTDLTETTCAVNEVGVFMEILSNQFGCDSIVTTTVSLDQSNLINLSDTSCNPADVGVFTQDLSNQFGCDSTVITTITLSPNSTTNLTTTTCDVAGVGVFTQDLTNQFGCDSTVITTVVLGTSMPINLSSTTCEASEVGIFTQDLIDQFGCDSIVITSVTLLQSNLVNLSTSTCNPAEVGIFTQDLMNQFGCDSTVITDVILDLSNLVNLSDTSCDPDEVGTFTQDLINQFGCDSTVITTVSLIPSITVNLSTTSCNPTEVGIFTQDLTGESGCDSIVITTITLGQNPPVNLSATSCDPDEVGTFTQDLTDQLGCDSTVITVVSLEPNNLVNLTETSCDPDEVGTFTQDLINQFGCDSTVITVVSLNPSSLTNLTETSCDSDEVGVFTQDLTDQFGCDSTVITTVSLDPSNLVNLTDTSCNPDEVGTFTQDLINQFGCDSTVITVVSLNSSSLINITATSCDSDEVGTFTQDLTDQFGCDSIVITTVSLDPSNLVNLTETSCDLDEVGTFTQDLINQFGCDSTVITTVSLDSSNLVNLSDTSCDPDEVGTFTQDLVNQFGCDSIVVTVVELLEGSETNISEFTCDESSTGIFTQDLSNQFGCDSIVTTTILLSTLDECGVEMTVEEGIIPCGETSSSLTIIATVGEAPFSYTWSGISTGSGTIDALNVAEVINNLPEGTYTVELNSASGFVTSAQAIIAQNFPPSVSAAATSAYNGVEISCAGGNDGAASVEISGGTAPFQIAWSNGEDSTTINELVAGDYSVTVIDANGCSDISELNLTEPEPLELMFSINDIDCFEQSTGAVYTSLTGGITPYSFSLNDGDFQNSGDFADLSGGNYEVIAIDANGCYSAEILAINSALQVDVDLGEDLSIEFGEGIILNAIVNIPYDSIVSVVWTAADSLDCPECFLQAVSPIMSSTYAVNVVSTDGCPGEDIMTVYVDQEKHIYIPNAFSPNNDGVNDEFLIFARDEEVKNIKMLSVFSRWGENVAEFFDIQPNDINFGWNGRYKGEPLDPAIFSWVTVIEFKDGTEQIFKGDVTLLR